MAHVLDRRNFHVTVYDSFIHDKAFKESFKLFPNVDIIEGDVRDFKLMSMAIKNSDAVVMLAALVGEKACDRAPKDAEDINLKAPMAFAEAAGLAGVKRFVFISTDSVYGAREGEHLNEESSKAPLSLYARLKSEAEDQLLAMRKDSKAKQPLTILRLPTIFGLSLRMRFDLVANLLLLNAVMKKKATIHSGEQWRPFLHTFDVAHAVMAFLKAPAAKVDGQIFNVGANNLNTKFKDLGGIISNLVPDAEIEYTSNPPDLRDYFVNFDKIEKVLGYKPKTTLFEGLSALHSHLSGGHIEDPYGQRWRNS
jgi:nucleoside-diphosphate-sugar epimerase